MKFRVCDCFTAEQTSFPIHLQKPDVELIMAKAAPANCQIIFNAISCFCKPLSCRLGSRIGRKDEKTSQNGIRAADIRDGCPLDKYGGGKTCFSLLWRPNLLLPKNKIAWHLIVKEKTTVHLSSSIFIITRGLHSSFGLQSSMPLNQALHLLLNPRRRISDTMIKNLQEDTL